MMCENETIAIICNDCFTKAHQKILQRILRSMKATASLLTIIKIHATNLTHFSKFKTIKEKTTRVEEPVLCETDDESFILGKPDVKINLRAVARILELCPALNVNARNSKTNS